MREQTTDVVVIGAGAAGLAAARTLGAHGRRTVVLEARERVGGRLLTRDDPGLPLPIELGGEFVHGSATRTMALLRASGTVAIDTEDASCRYENGTLRQGDDPFETVDHVLERAATLRDDVSIADFVRDFSERERRDTLMIVSGFDAADPARASTKAIVAEWSGGPNGQTGMQFRPLGGYARMLHTLHEALDPARVSIFLATVAHAVRWTRDGVVVEASNSAGSSFTVRARSVIVSLPVGVLQDGTVRFDPPLPERTRGALANLVMGPVVKLVLRFRSAFWERLDGGRLVDAAFFHRAGATFPSFWSMLPLRAPILVAWAGGPNAEALAALDEGQRVAAALDDLRVLFGHGADPHGELEASYTHDWQRDPFSRGAYSYVAVGGMGAREALAAPVDHVLFFAGEATVPAIEAGTVEGALLSGERAALEALAALRP